MLRPWAGRRTVSESDPDLDDDSADTSDADTTSDADPATSAGAGVEDTGAADARPGVIASP